MTAVATPSPVTRPSAAPLHVRDAVEADNAALVRLAAACTMHGDIAMRVDRAPDFFALNRLEGESWRVGVVTRDGDGIIGCVAVARRMAYVNEVVRPIAYASDLKVHPDARGSGAADLLTRYASDAAADLCGAAAPVVATVLAGNTAMEHRARGPRGTVILSRFATLDVRAIPLLWRRDEQVSGFTVRAAAEGDLEEMSAVWRRYASHRQFADVTPGDPVRLAHWLSRAPGLALQDYLLAFDRAGRLCGFLGAWDQTSFKQLRVVGYSHRLALVRHAINGVARTIGAAPLPPAGQVMPALATVHVCALDPAVLRALLLGLYGRQRGGAYAFITVCLDTSDPLRLALRGMLPQSTMVHAYVTTARGSAEPARYSGRLMHYEAALV